MTTALGCQASLDLSDYSFQRDDSIPDASAAASGSAHDVAPPDAALGGLPASVENSADNDCDGRPDNELDAACRCEAADTRACPSEANGCRTAIETCVVSDDRASSSWSGCVYDDAEAGAPCDDRNDATLGDSCIQGACVGVQCLDDSHCSNLPATPVCKLAAGGGPAAINSCVECIDNEQCQSAGASRCANEQCVPCVADADCAALESTGAVALAVCDNGTCVQCTGPKNAACSNGTNACNSATRQCSPFPVGSADICQACVADSHCGAAERCALHLFGTTPFGPFCFPVATGAAGSTCARVPFSGLTASTTIDGGSANLCLLRETTCDGLVDYGVQACEADADCGAAGIADGLCDGALETCSVPCISSLDCIGNSCLGGQCEL